MAHRHPCPFFGKLAVTPAPGQGTLVPADGNQCALAYRPCYLEARGDPPELEACEWNHSARAHEYANFPTAELPPERGTQ